MTHKLLLAVLLPALLLIASVAPATQANARGNKVLVIGDSLTARSKEELQAKRPNWTIDAERGRNVTELHDRIRAYKRKHGKPDGLVVALGTNASKHWQKSDYRKVFTMVNKNTRVVFVAPYRESSQKNPHGYARTAKYAKWMNQLARDRAHTRVAPWRWHAKNHPWLLEDGVHQKPKYEKYWATVVTMAYKKTR